MKKIVYSLLAASLLAGLTACSDDDKTVPSSVFDQGSVTSVAKPGEVVFHWTKPSDPDYYYVKVKYDDPQKGVVVKDASAYADSIVIDGLYAKYGALNYQFSFVSRDGGETAPFTVSAQAGAVKPTVKDAGLGDAIALTGADLWTDDQESSEGPLKDLVDGNASTYFHMSWSNPSPFPHYIVVDLKKEVYGVTFSYICRNQNNKDNPKQITVLGSEAFGQTTDDLSKAFQLDVMSGLPGDKAASYESSHIISSKPFRYLWLRIDSSTSGSNWVALAELSVTEVKTTIYDPENE
uniref:DUF4959 domain-containing protein n=1 Tax=Prevotella sp. TaxID=59823 RepID=UPI003FEF178D